MESTHYPAGVSAAQWAESPLSRAPADDEALRAVAQRYLSALFDALSDWHPRGRTARSGAAQWPEKFKYTDDRLSYFGQKVRLALESADGPRELSASVLAEFDCTPAPWDHRDLTLCHTEVSGSGWIEVSGMLRRELPMLVSDVGASLRDRHEARRAALESRQAPTTEDLMATDVADPPDAQPGSHTDSEVQP